MSVENKETVESLKNKILFWKKKIEHSRNMEERALLDSKIRDAKQKIRELEMKKFDRKAESFVDAPSIADHDGDMVHLSRGQIMNSGNVFSITI